MNNHGFSWQSPGGKASLSSDLYLTICIRARYAPFTGSTVQVISLGSKLTVAVESNIKICYRIETV